jgi:hypothetical protein
MYYEGRWGQGFFDNQSKPSHPHVSTWLICWLLLLLSPLFWSLIAVSIALYLQNMDAYLDELTKWVN